MIELCTSRDMSVVPLSPWPNLADFPAAQQPHQSVGSAGTFVVNNFEDDEDSDEGEWYVPENVGPTGMPIVSGQSSTPLVNGHQVKYA